MTTENSGAAVAEETKAAPEAKPASSQPSSTLPPMDALPATRPAGAAGRQTMGMMPTTIEDGWRLAQILAKSGLVPQDFQGKPENVLVAIQLGIEVGFAPMQALQSIAVINGRPSIWGDGFNALLVASPKYRRHEEYYEVAVQKDVEVAFVDPKSGQPSTRIEKQLVFERRDGLMAEDWKRDDTAAVCSYWRADQERPTTARFTVGQARKAGLLTKKGPWENYPDRMLKMRARSWAGRDAFPDVLRGIRTTEEATDEPEDFIETTGRVEPQQPRRASEARPSSPQTQAAPPATSTATAPATSDSSSSAPATAGETIRGLKVTHTGFVKPKVGEPYYDITMTTSTGAERKFLTREERIYREAASFEGTQHLVVAGYHKSKKDTADILVLDSLGIYEGAAPAGNGGEPELFS